MAPRRRCATASSARSFRSRAKCSSGWRGMRWRPTRRTASPPRCHRTISRSNGGRCTSTSPPPASTWRRQRSSTSSASGLSPTSRSPSPSTPTTPTSPSPSASSSRRRRWSSRWARTTAPPSRARRGPRTARCSASFRSAASWRRTPSSPCSCRRRRRGTTPRTPPPTSLPSATDGTPRAFPPLWPPSPRLSHLTKCADTCASPPSTSSTPAHRIQRWAPTPEGARRCTVCRRRRATASSTTSGAASRRASTTSGRTCCHSS
mmetsp:Transcript_27694/g.67146  ORF Transcript_27694/g.67146 Transcript_27694/m.67146 type:complete len:262 (+) Transcript_27694:507-1292(+)